MPVALSEQVHEEIFRRLSDAFLDVAYFQQLIAPKLRNVIRDSNKVEIDIKTARKLTERYFDVNEFKTEQEKIILQMIHLVLRTAYVLILSYHPQNRELLWKDVRRLVEEYPQFEGQDEEELRFLLNFRNYLRLALIIIPARLCKQLLIKIAARLEGSRKEYITGGGQKQCVTRRVEIYEHEGHIHAEKRTERIRPNRANGEQPKKRTAPQALLRETKLRRLPSDDVSRLMRNPNENRISMARPPMMYNHNNNNIGMSGSAAPPMPPQYNPNMGISMMPNQYQAMPPPPAQPASYYPSYIDPQTFDNMSGFPGPPALETMTSVDIKDLNELFSYGNNNNEDESSVNSYPLPSEVEVNNSNVAASIMTDMGPPQPMPYNISYPPRSTAAVAAPAPLGRQLSDSFPPTLTRATSEALNVLLPGGDLWQQLFAVGDDENNTSNNDTPKVTSNATATAMNTMANAAPNPAVESSSSNSNVNPLQLMRSISWDVYNGSFSEDLQSILGQV